MTRSALVVLVFCAALGPVLGAADEWAIVRGSIILPQRKSPVDPDSKYCSYGRCESGFVIQKLRSFADEQD